MTAALSVLLAAGVWGLSACSACGSTAGQTEQAVPKQSQPVSSGSGAAGSSVRLSDGRTSVSERKAPEHPSTAPGDSDSGSRIRAAFESNQPVNDRTDSPGRTDGGRTDSGRTDSGRTDGSGSHYRMSAATSAGPRTSATTGAAVTNRRTSPTVTTAATTRATSTAAGTTTEAESETTTETESPPETEPENVQIYLSVDCVNALSATDGSAADIAGAIAGSGYLYGPSVITLPAGSSAYDALAATGLSISASNTGMGLYVQAIQGLAEKDGGSQSGWMYLVDGSPPMQSADSYILSSGSSLKWRYTLTQGGDIYFD